MKLLFKKQLDDLHKLTISMFFSIVCQLKKVQNPAQLQLRYINILQYRMAKLMVTSSLVLLLASMIVFADSASSQIQEGAIFVFEDTEDAGDVVVKKRNFKFEDDSEDDFQLREEKRRRRMDEEEEDRPQKKNKHSTKNTVTPTKSRRSNKVQFIGQSPDQPVVCPRRQYFNTSSNTCLKCLPRCATCSSGSTCDSCHPGFSLSDGSCLVNLPTCKSYQFADLKTNRCNECSLECKTCSSENVCTSCYFDSTLNGESCSPIRN